MAADPQNIAAAVSEVTERATTLIREEIELAKAEVTEKVTKLIKGAIVGLVAGIFVVTALMFILHGFAWLATFELFNNSKAFWGFFIVAGVLLLVGGLAGYLAAKALKSGAPPTPEMAIEEARKIKDTVTARELGR
ncbi:MAG TPA: phage holin family protein [Solirubrobacteraceae bacterium]|nr:phage holin family protein [Solirubrobacteraceae bacterium]